MRSATFTIDTYGDEVFQGFTAGESWNGWACPYFDFNQAMRIVEEHQHRGGKAWYDEANDSFVFSSSQDSNDEPDAFPGELIDGQKLYPIGAFCWIWEEELKQAV